MATIQYARLYPDTTQLQAKDGHNLTAGWVEVYLAGTDDPAITYADFNGTRNPQRIVVDDNGRFCAIVDKSKAYRVEVYDADGMLQWTTEPVWCTGNAGAGMSVTRVVSTDGSIAVEENIDGSERTYDLSIAPSDSDEFLEWIKCSEEDCGSTWYPVYQAGTMETEAGQGIKVHGGHLYHFTNTFYVDPNGTGINYDTFKVLMYCNDEIVDVRDFDIDSSLNDSVMCEFSTDLIPSADGFVYYKLTIPSTCEVTAEVQCHRIYSGINAVPDTCATKQWVQETFDYNMAEKISYSALEYNGSGYISGISGSAIAGGLDSATVSAIASSYAESAISSISGWSADFSSISSKLDKSASGDFVTTSTFSSYSSYVESSISSISSKADASSLSAYQPVSAMSAYATESYVDSAVSGKLDVTASSLFITALPGDLATTGDVASAVSGKLDKSASGEFYPMNGNPSGFLTAHQSLAGLATVEYVDSSVSSKLDASAYDSARFQPASSMSSWIPYSALDYSGTAISGIGGSSLAGMGGEGHTYTGINPVVVNNTADTISVEHRTLCVDSTMTAYNSGSSAVIGVNVAGLDISSKMDASASSLFYSTSNPSGFVDAASASAIASAYQVVSATATQLNAGTAYLTSVNETPISASRAGNAANASLANSAWYDGTGRLISALPDEATVSGIASAYAESAVSSKLDESATADFYSTSNPSGYITGVDLSNYATTAYVDSSISSFVDSAYVESQVSSKQDTLTFDWDADSAISSINGSALAGQGGGAPIVVTGTAWDPDTSAYVYPTSNLSAAERQVWTYQNGNKSGFIKYLKDDSGNKFPMMAYFLAAGAEQMYNGGINGNGRLQFSPSQSMFSADGSNKYGLSPLTYATGASMNLSAGYFRASYRGDTIFISRGPTGTIDSSNSAQIKAVRIEAHNSRGSNISAYDATTTGYYGSINMSVCKSGVSSDDSGNTARSSVSARLSTGSLLFHSAGSSESMSITSIPYWNEKIDGSALGWLEVND